MSFPRALVALAIPVLLLAGCATPADPGDAGDVVPGGGQLLPIAAPGEVTGQGTVLQLDGEAAQFCLGGVMESYPPQCSGPELIGWEWPDDGMWESSNGVTWGTYAVSGTWDGVVFTVGETDHPAGAVRPDAPEPDPRADPANAADNSEELLTRVQDELQRVDRRDSALVVPRERLRLGERLLRRRHDPVATSTRSTGRMSSWCSPPFGTCPRGTESADQTRRRSKA